MAYRFDDDPLSVKEAPVGFLDLKNFHVKTQTDLLFALKKIPDLKLRKEKVIDGEIIPHTAKQKKTGFNGILAANRRPSVQENQSNYGFGSPVPDGMQAVKVRDVSQVDIDWKMLTLDRPKAKTEEDVFSRFVELDRMKLKTMTTEAPRFLYSGKLSIATILPTTAPGQKRSKSKKSRKKKEKSSNKSESEDEEDESSVSAPTQQAATLENGGDDEDENPTEEVVGFVDKFTYDYYARHIDDSADLEDIPDGKDDQGQMDEEKQKKDSTGKSKVLRRKNSKKPNSSSSPTELVPPAKNKIDETSNKPMGKTLLPPETAIKTKGVLVDNTKPKTSAKNVPVVKNTVTFADSKTSGGPNSPKTNDTQNNNKLKGSIKKGTKKVVVRSKSKTKRK